MSRSEPSTRHHIVRAFFDQDRELVALGPQISPIGAESRVSPVSRIKPGDGIANSECRPPSDETANAASGSDGTPGAAGEKLASDAAAKAASDETAKARVMAQS